MPATPPPPPPEDPDEPVATPDETSSPSPFASSAQQQEPAAPAPATPPPAPAGADLPTAPMQSPPAARSKTGLIIIIAIAVVAAIVVGGLVLLLVSQGGESGVSGQDEGQGAEPTGTMDTGLQLSLPDEVQGHPKLEDPLTKGVIGQLEGQSIAGAQAEAAFYGTKAPAYFIVGFELSGEGQSEEFFQGFVSSFGAVDESHRVSEDRDGVNYSCVPIDSSNVPQGAGLTCLWTDSATVGAIVSFLGEGPEEGIDLAESIHGEIVS